MIRACLDSVMPFRATSGHARQELVSTKPNVLIGASELVASASAASTSEIPIVITVMGDPIAIGLTNSLSHPSRNVTGFTQSSSTLSAKRG